MYGRRQGGMPETAVSGILGYVVLWSPIHLWPFQVPNGGSLQNLCTPGRIHLKLQPDGPYTALL